MDTTNTKKTTRLPSCLLAIFSLCISLLGSLLGSFVEISSAAVALPLFDAPPAPVVPLPAAISLPAANSLPAAISLPAVAGDEVFLVSTRAVGTVCSSNSMCRGLRCQRLVTSSTGQMTWKTTHGRRLLLRTAPTSLPTIVYVHGNRIDPGQDRAQGMQVFRSLKTHCRLNGPIRFIIWSWPSGQIPGRINDYLVKAKRTNPAAWQLAWFLDRLPVETQISLVGYSYGSRVVSGATHLLAGGRLGPLKLKLPERMHPQRLPVRAALLAAAYDANWIEPGHFYGRSLGQLERLVLATNALDPVMRFFHLSNGRGRIHALGKSGVDQPWRLGAGTNRLQRVDFTREVGRSHSLVDYLAAEENMSMFWHQLMTPRNPAINGSKFFVSAAR